jgi:hypothetical protein
MPKPMKTARLPTMPRYGHHSLITYSSHQQNNPRDRLGIKFLKAAKFQPCGEQKYVRFWIGCEAS